MSDAIKNAVRNIASGPMHFHGGFNAGQNKFSLPSKTPAAEAPAQQAQTSLFRASPGPTFTPPPSLDAANITIGNGPLVPQGTGPQEGIGNSADLPASRPFGGVIANDSPFANGAFGYTTPRGIVTGDDNSASFTPYRNGPRMGVDTNLIKAVARQMLHQDVQTIRRDPTTYNAGIQGARDLMAAIAQNGLPTQPGQAVMTVLPEGVAIDSPEGRAGTLGAALALTGGRGTPIDRLEQNPTLLAIAMPSSVHGSTADFKTAAQGNLKAARISHALAKADFQNDVQLLQRLGQLVPAVQQRVAEGQANVGEAQKFVQDVTAAYGANSPQAAQAQQLLQGAQQALQGALMDRDALSMNLMQANREVQQSKFDVTDTAQQLRAAHGMVKFAKGIEGDTLTDKQKVQAAKINARGFDTNPDGVLGFMAVQNMIASHFDRGDTSGKFDLVTGNPPQKPVSIPIDMILRQQPGVLMDAPVNNDRATG